MTFLILTTYKIYSSNLGSNKHFYGFVLLQDKPQACTHTGIHDTRCLARNDSFTPLAPHLNLELRTTQKLVQETELVSLTCQACTSVVLSPSGSWK
jgi:hypothetical protein